MPRYNPALRTEDLKDLIGADTLSVKGGVYTARLGFFYTFSKSEADFAK